jgi:hypothetical protein
MRYKGVRSSIWDHNSASATSYHLPRVMPAFTQFRLPDPLAQWPWPRQLNPYYAEVRPKSEAWLRSFEILDVKSQRSFDRCNFGKYLVLIRLFDY